MPEIICMVLNKLSLTNFRNYSKLELTFSSKTNLIIGPNSAGKTNILEAIYFLASGKSFRVKGVESEAIKYGEEIARVIGEIGRIGGDEGGKWKITLEIVLTTGEVAREKTGKKKYLVNGVGKKAFDFVGNLRAVYFGPEDLELITDSPSLRRKYLDMVLYQVDKEYARASLSYEKGLRSRNKILEEMKETGVVDRRRLYFWDQLLIKNGNIITSGREKFINFLNSREGFGGVGGIGDFSIEHDKSTISGERLAKYGSEEIAAGATLVGPHRDDFSFQIRNSDPPAGGRNLSVYGSRGEQRLAILWLKLGEMTFIKEKTADFPILLLDDIFSELDVEHRKLVFDLINGQQTIMTTADLGMVEKGWLEGVKIITLGSD